jgi:energy-coupling factor transport system permease protein
MLYLVTVALSTHCFLGRLGLDRAPGLPLLKDITLGRFIPGRSVVHKLDPRSKILATGCLVIALMAAQSGLAVSVLLLLFVVVAITARLPARLLVGNLKPLLPLILLTFGLNAILTPGRTILELPGGIGHLTDAGIYRGLFLTGRFAGLVLVVSLLTLTTSPLDLADGLEWLLAPFRRIGVPTHELAMTTTIALRFIPILVDEANRLRNAQLARGADFGGGPVRRIRSLFPLLLPLFVSAFGRADRLAVAMEARCYRGEEGRTRYRVLAWQWGDGLVIGAGVSLVAAALFAAWR